MKTKCARKGCLYYTVFVLALRFSDRLWRDSAAVSSTGNNTEDEMIVERYITANSSRLKGIENEEESILAITDHRSTEKWFEKKFNRIVWIYCLKFFYKIRNFIFFIT